MTNNATTITVSANGRDYAVERGMTVADFVRARGLDPRMVVAERNGEPVTPAGLLSTRLGDGDRLEIVRVVAGG